MNQIAFPTELFLIIIFFIVSIVLILFGLAEKDKKKNLLIISGVLLAIISLYLFFLNIQPAREAFAALATVVVAGVAIIALLQNKNLHLHSMNRELKDRKERLLNEIIEWALEIRTASLQPFPPISVASIREILLRYSIPSTKNEYIMNIATETFKDQNLQRDITSVTRNSTGFIFFTMLASGNDILDSQAAFIGNDAKTVADMHHEFANGELTRSEWIDLYRRQLIESISSLLLNLSRIKTQLLRE